MYNFVTLILLLLLCYYSLPDKFYNAPTGHGRCRDASGLQNERRKHSERARDSSVGKVRRSKTSTYLQGRPQEYKPGGRDTEQY